MRLALAQIPPICATVGNVKRVLPDMTDTETDQDI